MTDEKDVLEFRQTFCDIENEVGRVIIGQKTVVRQVLTAMVAGGNVLLEGLPGLGKTQLVKALGQVLALQFSRIQFTPDLMPADVTGTNLLDRQAGGGFVFQPGPVFANLVLADEINRATPKTQCALLEAMQERTVTVAGKTYALPSPHFVLATQNPLEMEGTYPLPEAQMDRFLFKIFVEFPGKEELLSIVELTTGAALPQPRKIADGATLLKLREAARAVPVARPVAEYMMDLVLKTHPETAAAPDFVKQYVRYGASPRAAQALMESSRIYALLAGRFNVAFDDVKAAAHPVLRHRLFLNFEGLAEGLTPDALIDRLLAEAGQ